MKNKKSFREWCRHTAALGLTMIVTVTGVGQSMQLYVAAETVQTQDQTMMKNQADTTESGYPLGGYIDNVKIGNDLTQAEQDAWSEVADNQTEDATGSVRTSSEWDIYRSDFFYNQMTDNMQVIYDALYDAAVKCIDGKETITQVVATVGKEYSITSSEAETLARIFKVSNPQFYFIQEIQGGGNGMYFILYEPFRDGAARAKATAAVKKQITEWVTIVNKQTTELEKERAAYQVISENVIYDYNAINFGNDFKEQIAMAYYAEKYMTQSAYSALIPREDTGRRMTVCAGVAQAFTMLCNAVGVDCVSVTSADHQWNKVRINDSWYNTDCTSCMGTLTYQYFNRSDAKVYEMGNGLTSKGYWNAYLPSCTLDSNAESKYDSVQMPEITTRVETPTMTVTDSDGTLKVTLKCNTGGADIFYNTSSKTSSVNPSQASSRSKKYKGTFTVASGTVVKAIAVKDANLDSGVLAQTLISHTIPKVNAKTPVIGTQPKKADYKYKASTIALSVKATVADSGKLTYQWYKNTKNAASGGTKISGATSSSYRPASTTLGTNYYYCVITNTNSSATGTKTASITSKTAQVTVTKASQSITASNKTKAYSKGGTIKLGASVKTGDGKLSYSSGNKAVVTVSSKGVLTMKGTGKATITIKAAATSHYNACTKKITVTIKPKKESISKVTSTKAKTLTVTWKKDTTVTGYQIQYSLKSNFKGAKNIAVSKSSTSRKLTGLAAKKKYYVRIRGYKTVSGTKLYGEWSATKGITVKK